MNKYPTRLTQPKSRAHYKTKEQWLIECLMKMGIDVEQTIHRRLERAANGLGIQEQKGVRQAIIASIIKQHGITLMHMASSANLECLMIDGQVISIWNDGLKVAFHVEDDEE